MSFEKMFEEHARQDEKRFDSIEKKLDTLIEAYSKQQGFVNGFAAGFTMLASAVVGLVVYIWNNLR